MVWFLIFTHDNDDDAFRVISEMLVPYWSVCCCSEVITSFAINWPEWSGVSLNYKSFVSFPFYFLFFSNCFKSKAHTFVVKRCRRRNNINVRCITSLKRDLLIMKRNQLLCWNGSNRRKPPDTSQRRQFRRRSSSVKFPIRLAVGCLRGLSACTYVRIFIFY